jgi:hypothetical protein
MKSLKESSHYLKAEKREFHMDKVTYLGLIVGVSRIRKEPEKVHAVENWEALEKLEDIQAFVGFANFYQRFIRDDSKVVQLLRKLTKKSLPFYWRPHQKMAFVEF